jgi:RNA polymerase sigma factor (sigma-70 family)
MATAVVRRDETSADSLAMYLDEIGRAPLLTAEDEVELARAMDEGRRAQEKLKVVEKATERRFLQRQVNAGRDARDRFIESNLRLVVSIAKRYRPSANGMDLLDLIQEGNFGLIRAVEKFDWRKGFKFSTYATWWIRQSVQRALLEKGSPVRVPSRVHDAAVTVHGMRSQFQASQGRSPSLGELAELSGLDVELVAEALAVGTTTSLEAPIGEDGAVLGDFVEMEGEEGPEDLAVSAGVSADLRRAIDRLDDRERLIMLRRFGFHDDVPHARAEIGAVLGVTPERVQQIEKAALTRLRHPAFGLRESDLV